SLPDSRSYGVTSYIRRIGNDTQCAVTWTLLLGGRASGIATRMYGDLQNPFAPLEHDSSRVFGGGNLHNHMKASTDFWYVSGCGASTDLLPPNPLANTRRCTLATSRLRT